MIILHIISDLTTGGAELMLARLAVHQSRGGRYRHKVISLRTLGQVGPQLQAAGIQVEALGMTGPVGLAIGFVRLVRRIRQIEPDIVQTWLFHADLIGGLAARLAGRRRILWAIRIAEYTAAMGHSRSSTWVRRLCVPLSRFLPQRIVYVAESAKQVHEALGYDSDKGLVIPNGYSMLTADAAATARRRSRGELGLGEDAILIGSAGRFSPQKGYRGFVEAAGAIARRFPEAHFLMLGRDIAWENDDLAGWIREAGLGDRIHLLGERRDVLDWLAALDIFVLFSIGEGFPNVVAEAMSVGVPCVVTDVGDAAALVGDTGIVIDSGDLAALIAGIERLIRAGAGERARLGAAGRRRVETLFSISSVAERYAKLYDEMAGKDHGGVADAPGNELEHR